MRPTHPATSLGWTWTTADSAPTSMRQIRCCVRPSAVKTASIWPIEGGTFHSRYSTARATVASGSVSNGFSCAELRQSDASVSGESLPRRDARVLVSAAPLVPGITAGRACKTVCLGSRGIEGQNARCTGTFSIKQVWGTLSPSRRETAKPARRRKQ